jgi:hypothetical protein
MSFKNCTFEHAIYVVNKQRKLSKTPNLNCRRACWLTVILQVIKGNQINYYCEAANHKGTLDKVKKLFDANLVIFCGCSKPKGPHTSTETQNHPSGDGGRIPLVQRTEALAPITNTYSSIPRSSEDGDASRQRANGAFTFELGAFEERRNGNKETTGK